MTDDEWERLRPFAEAEAAARGRLNQWAQSNAPDDLRARLDNEIVGARLRIEHEAARSALDRAKKLVASGGDDAEAEWVAKQLFLAGDETDPFPGGSPALWAALTDAERDRYRALARIAAAAQT